MRSGETPVKFGGFVGRERELGELRHALAETRDGRGRLFLISGEPGIGKTRLTEEIAREAGARGMRAVWGRCWEGGGAPAYWPWIQVIRGCVSSADPQQRRAVFESEHGSSTVETVAQMVPELRAFASDPLKPPTTPINAEQARFILFDSVANLLKDFARLEPLTILLDDLHDADDSSLIMLQFVAREVVGTAILILGTYRVDEVRQSAGLSKQIGEISREARSISLTGLSEAEVAQYIALNSGQTPDEKLAARLHAATGGNPLFVDGIVRMLVADPEAGTGIVSDHPFKIPHTLRDAIRRRLAVLSDSAQSLLNVAAALGNEFEADVCMRAGGVSRDQFNSLLDEAQSGGIVTPLGQSRYRFAHALIRGGLYDALDTNKRMQLHGRIAEEIETIHAKDLPAHLAELAHHFDAAGMSEKAIEYSRRAAEADDMVFAYAGAAPHWRRAVALSEGHNDARRAEILIEFGRIRAFQLDPVEGIGHLEAALKLYRELKDGEGVARANMILGIAIVAQGEFAPGMNIPRALEYFRQAQEWTKDWIRVVDWGWLYHGLSIALFFADRIDEAIMAAQRARQIWARPTSSVASAEPVAGQRDQRVIAGQVGGELWVIAAAWQGQLLVVKGRLREADQLFQEAAIAAQKEEASETANPEIFKSAMQNAGWSRMALRDPIEANRFYTMALERKGIPPNQREALFDSLAIVELMAGNLARAKAIAAEHQVNPSRRSYIAFREGDWKAAIEMNFPMLEWARRTGYRWDEADTLSILSSFLRVNGDLPRADEFLRQTMRSYDPGDLLLEMKIRPLAALIAIEMGRPKEAVQHLEVCRGIIAQGEQWLGVAGLVERAEGTLAAAQNRVFASHFEKAIANFQRYSLPWDEADALYDWGVALMIAGEYSLANAKFDAAIGIYRRHGAGQRWLDRVETAKHSSVPAAKGLELKAKASELAIFRKEGEFWTLTCRGPTFRLKDSKGLAYIAILLAHPGERFHAKELVAILEGSTTDRSPDGSFGGGDLSVTKDLGGPDPGIDPRARTDYRRRLKELQAEHEEAQRFNDIGRAARAREELELVNVQLTTGTGFYGHAHQSGTHAERARLLVRKNIRAALDKIRRRDPALGRHFATSISTGYFCAYEPDPDATFSWQLEAD
jgi:tetratricopeptide (TPR) repeat protein